MDKAGSAGRFFQCWRDLSEALRNYTVEDVAYELMNEPVADDPEDWNKLVEKAVVIIRQAEPLRKIIIGSNGGKVRTPLINCAFLKMTAILS